MIGIDTPKPQAFEQQHFDKLREIAPDCMVLLKKNGDFPLNGPCDVALYGSGARHTVKGGTGSGDVNVRKFSSVEEALEQDGFVITTKPWLEAWDTACIQEEQRFCENVREEAKQKNLSAFFVGMGRQPAQPQFDFPINAAGEVCVYVLSRASGEGADRTITEGDYLLSTQEIREIRECAEKYPKFMLVLNVGGPLDITPVLDVTENILLLGQLGSATGEAFSDVLLGRANPSGRLTADWVAAEQLPTIAEFGNRDDTHYREGIFVGYRYYEAAKIQPVFPFGYGLSYTEFSVQCVQFQMRNLTVELAVTVANTGSRSGKYSTALYYSVPHNVLPTPVRELGAFGKTKLLLPGKSEKLTLTLPLENMALWDEKRAAWVLPQGTYTILLEKEAVGLVTLNGEATVAAGTKAAYRKPDFADWTPQNRPTEILPSDMLQEIMVEAEALSGIGHYDREAAEQPKLDKPNLTAFTEEELIHCCVGRLKEGGGSVIGAASPTVAGAAGETNAVIARHGFGKLVLADGPAGLRLCTKYRNGENGAEELTTESSEIFLRLMEPQQQQALRAQADARYVKAAEQGEVRYQYCSAIPVGTALAQSWDAEAAMQCGRIVAEEMERFGVQVWLAPALNIQRSPLCGRNFEYYAEDPVLSGRIAAAMTKGVQGYAGRCVTIKHFACNNQETNRYGSNSILSERALREVYLKGFEICVKTAAPRCLMTSYNLINGIHTANDSHLLTDILRREWGFQGVVMTDWGTTALKPNADSHYGPADAAECLRAGNDLIMPGGETDVQALLSALRRGTLTRTDLEQCAGRIIGVVSAYAENAAQNKNRS